MIDSFIEDLLIANVLAVFNRGGPVGMLEAERVVHAVPRERLATLWPARRSRSLS